MGQAKRKKEKGVVSKRQRFIHLMRVVSGYSEYRIKKFCANRESELKGDHKV